MLYGIVFFLSSMYNLLVMFNVQIGALQIAPSEKHENSCNKRIFCVVFLHIGKTSIITILQKFLGCSPLSHLLTNCGIPPWFHTITCHILIIAWNVTLTQYIYLFIYSFIHLFIYSFTRNKQEMNTCTYLLIHYVVHDSLFVKAQVSYKWGLLKMRDWCWNPNIFL